MHNAGRTGRRTITAFKLQEQNGKTVLAPAWVSPDLLIPSPPVIVNGVVFVISSGEYVRQSNDNNGTLWNAQQRADVIPQYLAEESTVRLALMFAVP